jgi:MinD-like ATPase involved in chromosome partitioning or flagellar assembly
VLFGLDAGNMGYTLNDYLYGHCPIEEVAHVVSGQLSQQAAGGALYLLPSRMAAGDIAKVLRENYEIHLLLDGLYELSEVLKLDYLLLDTHPDSTRKRSSPLAYRISCYSSYVQINKISRGLPLQWKSSAGWA